MGQALLSGPLIAAPKLTTARSELFKKFQKGYPRVKRTYVGATEPLDSVYTPAFRIDARYESYFKPTMLTNARGTLSEKLYMDLHQN